MPSKRLHENRVFWLCAAFLLCRYWFAPFNPGLDDVLPSAKQAFHPGWLARDWYLSLPSGNRDIRLLYDWLVGPFTGLVPLTRLAFAGTAAVYLLFAWLIQAFCRSFAIKARWALPALFLLLHHQGLVAGEFILGGFEAKCFAYFFAFLALLAVVEKRPARAAFFQGLAVSFHVLVGLHSAFCLAAACLLDGGERGGGLSALARRWWLFALGASAGIYGAARALWLDRGADAAEAARVYVSLRVPHHLLPSAWRGPWALGYAGVAVVVLASWRLTREPKRRFGWAYLCASLAPAAVGFAAFAAGKTGWLMYYWFRFPDAAIPFVGCWLLAAAASAWSARRPWADSGAAAASAGIAGVAALSLAVPSLRAPETRMPSPLSSGLQESLEWIRDNTEKDRVFLVSPFVPRFYLVAERAELVSFKCVPQTKRDLLAWRERLVAANAGREPSRGGWPMREEVEANFYALPAEEISALARRYGLDYYLGRAPASLPFPVAHANPEYVLYKLN